ncbi:hypothetical protein [Rhizobium lusitanum]|uniref:hypothetical protein n=1 Tax=Rhizobium lusitanum TaxID=293958 RepID=UPI001956E7DE|nr:hypothetical protein [Rhizobium lusitanum]MBM7049709.1 hypothetical protein [Rhizobium lusitanum]
MKYPEAEAIFEEFDIRVVPANVVPAVRETRAVATLHRIAKRYGKDHARFIVMTFAETANSQGSINEHSLWAVSDMVRLAEKNFPALMTTDVSSWFSFFDSIPFGWMQLWSEDTDGIVPKRFVLVGMIYERMKRVFGPLHSEPDLFDDRRRA